MDTAFSVSWYRVYMLISDALIVIMLASMSLLYFKIGFWAFVLAPVFALGGLSLGFSQLAEDEKEKSVEN